MEKQKNIFKLLTPFLSLFLIGIIVGGIAVYGYFNFKTKKIPDEKRVEPTIDFNSRSEQDEAMAYLKFKAIKKAFNPTGVPEVYGKELNISFDQVQEAINKVAPFDLTYGNNKIDLNTEEKKRYVDIGSQIACEYCCGVQTLVFENGEAACGCDHSQMMRGLAAYLIKNHPQEFTNEKILEELSKWKITYFPKQTLSKELDRLAKSEEPGIEQILKEFPDFLPQMVGGC